MKGALTSLILSNIFLLLFQFDTSSFVTLADKYGAPTAFVLLLTVLVLWFQNKSDKDRNGGIQKLVDSSIRQELWLKSILAARTQENICKYFEPKTELKNEQ